jgi:hypothetical protein
MLEPPTQSIAASNQVCGNGSLEHFGLLPGIISRHYRTDRNVLSGFSRRWVLMPATRAEDRERAREEDTRGPLAGSPAGTPGLRSLISKDTAVLAMEIHQLIEDHEEDPRCDDN